MTEPAKPWYLKLPAKLGATVFFLVALTTLIGNLLELDAKRRERLAQPAAPGMTATPPRASPSAAAAEAPAPAPATERRLVLVLERIVVLHDGTVGTTDWRFAVEADGEPLFVLQQDDLDDTAGRNVALPTHARTTVRVPTAGARVTVKGWRGSRLRLPSADPDATGEGILAMDGTLAAMDVVAADPESGRFMLHFAAGPAD